MAEETESVRGDSASREVKQKEILDWSGKRVVLSRGTTLPAITGALPGETFILQRVGASDQLYIFDDGQNNWITVGP